MQKLLVVGSCDFADEFDCEFLKLFTQEEWDALNSAVKEKFKGHKPVEICFGTNEFLTIRDYDDWRSCFTVEEISDSTYNELSGIFVVEFGTGSGIFDILAYLLRY